MKSASVSYSQWKSLLTSKGLLPQYVDLVESYDLFAIEANVSWEVSLMKDGGSDVTDFEANIKPTANQPLEYRSTDGLLKVASSMFSDIKSFWVDGTAIQADIAAGNTVYIKKHFADEFTISGVDARWFGSNWGDYVSFEVGFYTDPTNESTFQLVQQFADHYMVYEDGNRLFDVPTVKIIPSTVTIGANTFDLYIRVTCVNTGANPSKVIINLVGWK